MFRSVKFRIVALFLIALAMAMVLLSVAAFGLLHRNEHGKVNEAGYAAAQATASLFDYAFDNGVDLTSADQYARLRTLLRGLCKEYDMEYLYAYECDLENEAITYLMCVAGDDARDALVEATRGYGTVIETELTEIELDALDGKTVTKAIEYDNRLGHTLDWVSPISWEDKLVLAGASYSVEAQRQRVFQATVFVLVPYAISLVLILLAQLRIMKVHLFDPINMIADRMRAFSVDDKAKFKPINVGTNDEIGVIADAFDTVATKITEYVANIERLTEERVQVNVELDVARRIQLGMVPTNARLEGAGFEVSAFSRAARAVGGDFYTMVRLDDGRIALGVGDVSGKGVAAALFMSMATTMLRDAFLVGLGPREALEIVNEYVCKENPEGMFVTVFACVFDPVSGELLYANAGHMLPFVIGEGVRELPADPGTLLGLFDDVVLTEEVVGLDVGQALLMYTDGANEAVNVDRKFLGVDAFARQLADRCPYATASEVIDGACRIVDAFTVDCEQSDDLTLLALMRREVGDEPDAFVDTVEVPCDISSLDRMREAILATEVEGALKRKACLVCEEIFVNIVSYSEADRVWFAVRSEGPARLSVTLVDNGSAFDASAAPLPDPEFEDLDSGGMGIGLVRELVSDMDYRRMDDRNVLVLQVVS